VRSYELADRMQVAAPDAVDLTKETDRHRGMYGLNDETSASYGTTLLRARRLVERGVRFIQWCPARRRRREITSWDAHSELEKNHTRQCRA
jgi:hypothetical protein